MSTQQRGNGKEQENVPLTSTIKNQSRRTFTKAGFLASGVLMTLHSRSVLACDEISPSGFCSANQSKHGSYKPSNCRKPQYWNSGCSWPVSKQVNFRDIFHSCQSHSPYYRYTCAQILEGRVKIDASSNHGVGQYFVAAYLNACMGWSEDFLPPSKCINMGNEWLQTDFYRPTANVAWNSSDIAKYFQNTQA